MAAEIFHQLGNNLRDKKFFAGIYANAPENIYKHMGLYRAEVSRFLAEQFPRIHEDYFHDLFRKFNIKPNDIHVFLRRDGTPGFFGMQEPLISPGGFCTVENATATFSLEIDQETGRQIFSIAGVTPGKHGRRILSARYEADSTDCDFHLALLDRGVRHDEHMAPDTTAPLNDLSIFQSGVITQGMIQRSGNKAMQSIKIDPDSFDFGHQGGYPVPLIIPVVQRK